MNYSEIPFNVQLIYVCAIYIGKHFSSAMNPIASNATSSHIQDKGNETIFFKLQL